ncbi:MAG: valine--tRNA ligase [Bryobacterales bacterium]|nr:valine--tRNA ligase [Bryobacterales bacterium]
MRLEKAYDPSQIEPAWAEWWVQEGLFRADPESDKPVFSLVIPPPNVTGALHMGHMFETSQVDITMRWQRMRGRSVLWLPGTDHAGIATQMLVERHLAKSGIDRLEIGRDRFLEHVWDWKEHFGGRIVGQLKRVGASCDWTRERFTMDTGLSRAVTECFVRLWERGLVYRGEYMVNWDPGTRTAISDLEVEYSPKVGSLWYLRYPVEGSDGEFITVATTRPETMLGDTAVAVHPADERFRHLHGRSVTLPLVGRSLPVICDEFVDPEFGTGVVKVTPAHDPSDFAAGQRHGLKCITVLDEEARINSAGGQYEGLDRYKARARVVRDLEALGLVDRVEQYTNNIGRSQRSGLAVEPRVSTQWFVRTRTLAEEAIRAVEDGRTQIIPDQWQRNYFEWMRNIRDWCVSRQLWWGHRIPAWHLEDGSIVVARSEREAREQATRRGQQITHRETDVLDTWFSSGLWPFSTMGWPDDTEDLRAFYPTSLLNTGFDILFFWVARMMMLGLAMTGEVPFHKVFIHGLVRDADKQKMSKTKGNVIDPIKMTDQYGTDAVRFALVASAGQGSDVVLKEERIAGYRTFANKIWNALRFVGMSLEKAGADVWTPEDLARFEPLPDEETGVVSLADRWIFSRLRSVAEEANDAIEAFRYHEVASTLYHFFWHEFCDWYIELKKLSFRSGGGLTNGWKNMLAATERSLRLLHPVMPFITEDLWQRLTANTPGRARSIALSGYPQPREGDADPLAERDVGILQGLVTVTRNLRSELGLPVREVVQGTVHSHDQAVLEVVAGEGDALLKLAAARFQGSHGKAPAGHALAHATEFDLGLDLAEGRKQAVRDKLEKQLAPLEKAALRARRRLANPHFTGKAPARVVDSARATLADYESRIERIRGTLSAI